MRAGARWSAELLAFSSASRKLGWYASAGVGGAGAGHGKFAEAGVKLRTIEVKQLFRVLPSARLGYRVRLRDYIQARDHRIVMEFGVGGW
jgi:hypothetical protein